MPYSQFSIDKVKQDFHLKTVEVEGRFDEKLVNFLRSTGVPDEQIVYLQDREATLEQIQTSLVELLRRRVV